MNLFKMLFSAAITFGTFAATAQTVDEVVAKNIEAMGGKEKLQTLKTVKMTGAMSVQGADVSIVYTKTHMQGRRMDIEVMGTSNYQVANTTKGAVFMPVFGMATPVDMSAAELQSAVAEMDIQSPLLDYGAKGNKVELAGTKTIDGAEAYDLQVTYKNGKAINYLIDKKTNRVVKTLSKEMVNGEEVVAEITYGDYKQNAAGYWFPYSQTNERGTITYSSIETNIAVDEGIYKN